MLKDYAKGKVLPEYTDEALREERFFKGKAAELLLLAPAEQRQNVEAQVVALCGRPGWGGLDDEIRVRREILAENGWLHTS